VDIEDENRLLARGRACKLSWSPHHMRTSRGK